jgi:hypothetical protein
MLWERGDIIITADKNRMDIDALHTMLSQTYWARGRPRDADDFYRQSGFEEMSKLKFMGRSWKM